MGQIRFKTTAELEAERLESWRESAKVSAFQAKTALLQAGYWEDVETLLQGADPITRLAWDTAQHFRRRSPSVLEIAEALSLTEEQLDDLFKFAATINA